MHSINGVGYWTKRFLDTHSTCDGWMVLCNHVLNKMTRDDLSQLVTTIKSSKSGMSISYWNEVFIRTEISFGIIARKLLNQVAKTLGDEAVKDLLLHHDDNETAIILRTFFHGGPDALISRFIQNEEHRKGIQNYLMENAHKIIQDLFLCKTTSPSNIWNIMKERSAVKSALHFFLNYAHKEQLEKFVDVIKAQVDDTEGKKHSLWSIFAKNVTDEKMDAFLRRISELFGTSVVKDLVLYEDTIVKANETMVDAEKRRDGKEYRGESRSPALLAAGNTTI